MSLETNTVRNHDTYSLQDILLSQEERGKHEYTEEYTRNCHANWAKQFKRVNGEVPEPSLIIPSWLYLGNKINACDKQLLLELGITHILNVTDGACYFVDDFVYAQIKVDDLPTEDISAYFDAATQFIDLVNPKHNTQNADQHLKVLVHCSVGKSRSASIVIQYLMRNGLDFENRAWLDQIAQFGLMPNFIVDDCIYQRSLSCFDLNSVLCCKCCLCWFKCCLCCTCCHKAQHDESKEDAQYNEWRRICDIGSMSMRNSYDYALKCREIVWPNEGFSTQIAELEETLRNDVSTFDLCAIWKIHGLKAARYKHQAAKTN